MRITTFTPTGRARVHSEGHLNCMSGSCPESDRENNRYGPDEDAPLLDNLTSVTFSTGLYTGDVTLSYSELVKIWEFAQRHQENLHRTEANKAKEARRLALQGSL